MQCNHRVGLLKIPCPIKTYRRVPVSATYENGLTTTVYAILCFFALFYLWCFIYRFSNIFLTLFKQEGFQALFPLKFSVWIADVHKYFLLLQLKNDRAIDSNYAKRTVYLLHKRKRYINKVIREFMQTALDIYSK